MTKELLKEYIRNLEKDTKILIKEKCHPRTSDLQMMVMTEDLPEILKFLKNINKVLNFKTPDVTGEYSNGYWDGINQIRNEILDD